MVKSKQETVNSRWVLIDVVLRNQNDEKVATGEAMVEFPHRYPARKAGWQRNLACNRACCAGHIGPKKACLH